ncbi:MAG: hypothetical protein ACYC6V_06970 [Bacillota bacterium]
MVKIKDIFLWAGGFLALIGSVWLGVVAGTRGRARRRGLAGLDPAAGRTIQDLAAQFADAAERAMGEIDRRSDELRLLLGKAEDRLAAIRGARPQTAAVVSAAPSAAAMGREAPSRATPSDLQTDPEGNLKNRFAVVHGLADQGLPVDEIAAKVKMTKGEVALIMGLRKAR